MCWNMKKEREGKTSACQGDRKEIQCKMKSGISEKEEEE